MRSMEGFAGEPRAKRIHATEMGLWDKPTVLNNVKTWASVPHIINRGADWFASIGTQTSKGTAIFSLVGKINNTGLVEVPMGITIRRLVNDIGGGIRGGKKLKAVQTGGPSGGCIPENLADSPVDYESLTAAGSMMGSGGMIVMDEDTCMVDTARYFMGFNSSESCGKCTACREGVKRMYDILEEITHGRGKEGDLQELELLGRTTRNGALCALGRTAPNPVLTTLRYFRDEYEAHIRDKRCPAGVCKDLITFSVIAENCTGCGVCRRDCPQAAITGEKKQVHVIDPDKCIRCGICREVCRFDAIKVE
jgi:NADH:ubiquinone oxidoreductase subunit F (NADH-binding)/Pyruvate/2-oxoacid:ferredoxin oxidoreductase delta subunit